MDYSAQLALSYYKPIATLNKEHNIFLVQHLNSHKIFVKKILTVYNIDVYKELAAHPICGIPAIIDFYEIENQLFLIENYISGHSLEELRTLQNLDLNTIIHYALELCTILSRLHNMNPPIVHRDIKPYNIIITEYNHVVLLDFNAAKHYSDSSSNDTVLLGTKGYAAPEQYGFGSSSPKTDIYALGVLLKELTASLPDVPTTFHEIIDTCIQLNPADRFNTVIDLANALKTGNFKSSGSYSTSSSLNNDVTDDKDSKRNPSYHQYSAKNTDDKTLYNEPHTVRNFDSSLKSLNFSDSQYSNSMFDNSKKNQNRESNNKTRESFSYRKLLLPGFRTLTPWKMLLAIPTYIFLCWISLSLQSKDLCGSALWIERIFCLFMFLSIILITFNYMDLQKYFPLCNSKYFIVRSLGVVLLNIICIAILLVMMAVIVSSIPVS